MLCIRKKVLFSGLALIALGASVIAITMDGTSGEAAQARPIAVNPDLGVPADTGLRAPAIPQPTGKRADGQRPIARPIANPQR